MPPASSSSSSEGTRSSAADCDTHTRLMGAGAPKKKEDCMYHMLALEMNEVEAELQLQAEELESLDALASGGDFFGGALIGLGMQVLIGAGVALTLPHARRCSCAQRVSTRDFRGITISSDIGPGYD